MKIIIAILLMALPGCSWFSNVGCSVQSAVSGAVATGVTKALNCGNPTQVLIDVTSLVAKTNICQAPASKLPQGQKGGVIASLVCPALANIATAELGTKIPANWECSPSVASGGLAMALTTACNLIPF